MAKSANEKNFSSSDVQVKENKVKEKANVLPEKHYVLRESLLTTLFESPHVKTIHHIFIAFFFGLFITTLYQDYIEHQEFNLGVKLMMKGFGQFPIALAGWVLYGCLTLLSYFCFIIWAKGRNNFGTNEKNYKKLWDSSAVLILLGYYIFCFRLAVFIVTSFQLPPASAAFILLEQTRLLMKVHAFVRSNAPKVLMYKGKTEQKLILPTFSYFIYFIAVPTLVYKDEYPRMPTIKWKVAVSYILEIIAVLFFYSFIMNKYFIPAYREFGIRRFKYNEVLLKILETSFASLLLFVTTFYLILHLIQNLFAEILRFGDRLFYKDWWTATNFTTYYRTWNVVVHDWLYTYIYKDCYEILLPNNKMFAKYVTFLISAVVHEWIMTHMLGYMFPLMFCLFFIFGTIFTHINPPKSSILNMLFWLSMSYGLSMLMCGYMLEYYARYNNVQPLRKDLDFYIPRSMTCDCYE